MSPWLRVFVACAFVFGSTIGPQAPPARAESASPAARFLAADEKLAYPAAVGDVGPFSKAMVFFTQKADGAESVFRGRVAATGPDGVEVVYPLPQEDETAEFFAVRILGVIFADADATSDKAIVVLYRAQKIAPGEVPYTSACVYIWRDGEFVRLPEVEARLDDAKSAREIIARLKTAKTK